MVLHPRLCSTIWDREFLHLFLCSDGCMWAELGCRPFQTLVPDEQLSTVCISGTAESVQERSSGEGRREISPESKLGRRKREFFASCLYANPFLRNSRSTSSYNRPRNEQLEDHKWAKPTAQLHLLLYPPQPILSPGPNLPRSHRAQHPIPRRDTPSPKQPHPPFPFLEQEHPLPPSFPPLHDRA